MAWIKFDLHPTVQVACPLSVSHPKVLNLLSSFQDICFVISPIRSMLLSTLQPSDYSLSDSIKQNTHPLIPLTPLECTLSLSLSLICVDQFYLGSASLSSLRRTRPQSQVTNLSLLARLNPTSWIGFPKG